MVASSKRGNAMPIIMFIGIAFLLILIIGFSIGNKILSDVNDMVQEDDDFNTQSKTVMQGVTDKNSTVLDNVFAFLYAGLIIGAFISGFTTNRTPVFLLLTIILLFVTGFVGAKISNFYDDFDGDAQELALSTNFPKAHFIMSNLPLFLVGIITLFGVGVILRNQSEVF